MGLRYAPYVFTEQGVSMLSSILNSKKAIEVNIQTVSYTHLRAHETVLDIVCRLLLEKKKYKEI